MPRFNSLLIGLLAATLAAPVFADPPAHAKAHGWRKKHDPDYQGYSGKKWDKDYGVLQGNCDARTLSETLGKSVGGTIGGKVGDKAGGGEIRDIAVIVGEVLGQAVSNKVLKDSGIGGAKDVDATDRACLAQALELARDGQKVAWTNPVSNVRYLLTPQRLKQRDGRQCRDFALTADNAGRKETTNRTACVASSGAWEIRK